MKKGGRHDTWPPIPPKVYRHIREGELTEAEGLAEYEPDGGACADGTCDECAAAVPRIDVTPEQAEWIAERIASSPAPSQRLVDALRRSRGGR
jgi:hypothetical protein